MFSTTFEQRLCKQPLGVGGGWMEDELRGRSVWSLDVCMELVKTLQV